MIKKLLKPLISIISLFNLRFKMYYFFNIINQISTF